MKVEPSPVRRGKRAIPAIGYLSSAAALVLLAGVIGSRSPGLL
jgi:hypothetical protein